MSPFRAPVGCLSGCLSGCRVSERLSGVSAGVAFQSTCRVAGVVFQSACRVSGVGCLSGCRVSERLSGVGCLSGCRVSERLLGDAGRLMEDVVDDFSQLACVQARLQRWRDEYGPSYNDAYISLCLPKLFSPLIRLSLVDWSPLEVRPLGGATV